MFSVVFKIVLLGFLKSLKETNFYERRKETIRSLKGYFILRRKEEFMNFPLKKSSFMYF